MSKIKKSRSNKKEKVDIKRKEENEVITKIRSRAKKDRVEREKKELGEIIKNRIGKFLLGRKLLKDIKDWEKRHEKKRKKKIVPDNGFGD